MCCWRHPQHRNCPQGKPQQVLERGPGHPHAGQWTNSHRLQEHRVKQMGSCNSIIRIIPEKPLTRPQITTLMLFSPVSDFPPQRPALRRTTTQISPRPWLTPLPIPSPPEVDPLSPETLTWAIAFGEWIPFQVTKTSDGGKALYLKPTQRLALRSPVMESVHRAIGSSFNPLSKTANGLTPAHPPFHLIRGS